MTSRHSCPRGDHVCAEPVLQLWHVKIAEGDWDYDRFDSAVVWAHDAEEAERVIRAERRYSDETADTFESERTREEVRAELWISPDWTLEITPAATSGVALVHWHAG